MMARKVMLLGEIGVGKSSLARRLVFDKFDFDYKPTIGVDVYRYEVAASAKRPAVSLILWDTDGNFGDAIFKHIYMKEAAAALIVGDMSRAPTLDTMAKLGDGFASAARLGTQAQDPYFLDGERIVQRENHSGGLEGGISTSAPLVIRAAFKPIATTLTPQPSVDLATGAQAHTQYERSDFCQVPRAVPIVEAMVCFVLAQALLQKLGGDSLAEIRPRLATLRKPRLSDLPMSNAPWSFGYE